MRTILAAIVVLLTLTVGILHFALDFVLFRGNLWGRLGPPPGAQTAPRPSPPPNAPRPPAVPLGLQLNQLFVINLALFALLAILFVALLRARPAFRLGTDVLIVLATLGTLYGWNSFGKPNPQGLGTWAVSIEVALVVLAISHAATLAGRRA